MTPVAGRVPGPTESAGPVQASAPGGATVQWQVAAVPGGADARRVRVATEAGTTAVAWAATQAAAAMAVDAVVRAEGGLAVLKVGVAKEVALEAVATRAGATGDPRAGLAAAVATAVGETAAGAQAAVSAGTVAVPLEAQAMVGPREGAPVGARVVCMVVACGAEEVGRPVGIQAAVARRVAEATVVAVKAAALADSQGGGQGVEDAPAVERMAREGGLMVATGSEEVGTGAATTVRATAGEGLVAAGADTGEVVVMVRATAGATVEPAEAPLVAGVMALAVWAREEGVAGEGAVEASQVGVVVVEAMVVEDAAVVTLGGC